MAKRRYVARGVPRGYQIWDNKVRRWWGEPYETCPDDLLVELNGQKRPDVVTALTRKYRQYRR